MTTKGNKSNIALNLLGLFLISSSLFIYEVLITRLFSTVLVYHFVFLVTSLSILGLGIGAIIIFFFEDKLRKILKLNIITFLSALLAISYSLITLIIYKLPYLNTFYVYSMVSSIPFIFGGMVLSLTFKEFDFIGHKLYFADLLGSSIGSIAIILLLDSFGFMITLFVTSIISLLGALLFSLKNSLKIVKISISLFIFLLLIITFNDSFITNLEENFTAYLTSPHTVISYWNKVSDEDVKIEYTKWDSISRTDVIDTGINDKRTIITDGGASAPMIRFDGDLEKVGYLKDKIEYIPFKVGSNDKTLLIGSGGGEDVILTLLGEGKMIDAIEINPSTIDAVKKYKNFNGGIYDLENVNLYIEDGRKFINSTNKSYDHIYLGKVFSGVVDYSAAMLSENYIYTKEAYKKYLNHIDDDGKLTFVFNDSRELIKSINTMVDIYSDFGVKREDITKHFIAINSYSDKISQSKGGAIWMPIVIYKKTPFTTEELNEAKNIITSQDRGIINLPETKEIQVYKQYANGERSYEELVDLFDFNAKPTTDNSPFFYDYEKGVPKVLLYMLVGTLLLGLIFFLSTINNKNFKNISIYFSIIGLGFMLIEIPLIQRAILFIGSTTRAFTFVLFSLLFSSGIGSFISGSKIVTVINKKRDYTFLIISFINVILLFISPIIFDELTGANNLLKFLVVFAMIFPLGIFIGMPFPTGIRAISKMNNHKGVPLAWGINGIMSVVSSILSLILSMKLGFNSTLILGTIFYLVLFIKNPLRA